MAFISERIKEGDKSKINLEELYSTKLCSFEPTFWVIDRDSDIFLIPLGGGGPEKPEFYGLYVGKNLITFHANRRGFGNNKIGIELFYKISCLTIPKSIESRNGEIKKIICEALEAYGQYGDPSHVASVAIEFN